RRNCTLVHASRPEKGIIFLLKTGGLSGIMEKMRNGFTLVELLIVVAIIAILAAIAVPNLLEAQARAKVARTMSDMGSTRTAMGAYTVDNNQHLSIFYFPYVPGSPEGHGGVTDSSSMMVYGASNDPAHSGGTGWWHGQLLTTPIAYMTAVPIDI